MFKKLLNEANKSKEDLFKEFVAGLEKLTKKTGWGVQSTGGVYFDDPSTIKKVKYTDDPTSGDIDYDLINK
jgi:hypothetical protein